MVWKHLEAVQLGWRAVAIICALIGLVVNTISCLAVKEVEPDESVRKMIDESKPQDDKLGFWESMKFLFTNKYYVLILVLYIVYYIMSNITTGSGVYFTKYKFCFTYYNVRAYNHIFFYLI